jgi:hypothetical protein
MDAKAASRAESCVFCLQPITNPMCADCYLRHLHLWLISKGMSDIESEIVVRHVKNKLPKDGSSHENCIVCGRELTICSYCFVFIAGLVMRDLKFSKDFEEDFEYMFSYKGGRV